MIDQHNFDWKLTNVPLCIFIPNYGRGSYIRNSLWQFKTQTNIENYKIIIGNDGIHEDFSDLKHLNVEYFTFQREKKLSRNGCFIRNFFIKRAECTNIYQKDPETIIQVTQEGYDWIDEYTKIKNMAVRAEKTTDINSCVFKTETSNSDISYRVHWGCLLPLQWLKEFPYCEDFELYGYEDTMMYYTIRQNFGAWYLDSGLHISHIGHEVPLSTYSEVNRMAEVYKNITRTPYNKKEWGNG